MTQKQPQPLLTLNEEIIQCRLCPRLVAWREQIAQEKRASFADWTYWGKAVPGFGDPGAKHLIVGLAPAAHGANRTGRMFTGDRSGDWLYRALHKAGVANQATSVSADDGLRLNNVWIAACCHCAPPDNKPTIEEISNCSRYLVRSLLTHSWTSILALGSLAWGQVFKAYGQSAPKFGHGSVGLTSTGVLVVGSYHPSQQNTFTGRLTEPMLDAAIATWLGTSMLPPT